MRRRKGFIFWIAKLLKVDVVIPVDYTYLKTNYNGKCLMIKELERVIIEQNKKISEQKETIDSIQLFINKLKENNENRKPTR